MYKPDICIYHGNCDDGFGAAWAIWKKWGNEVAFVPGVYGKPLPDIAGRHVLFVDFSAKRPELVAMADKAKSVVVIDHHKTAEADLRDWNGPCAPPLADIELLAAKACTETGSPIVAWFDMSQSGAVMAWDFAHGIARNDPPPTFLALIQDRDLWTFAYGDRTKQFSAALRTYPMTFETWSLLACDPDRLVKEGEGILRAHNANIDKFCRDAYHDYVGAHYVPIVNVPYHYASDTAHALLQMHPEAPFTACWFRRGDGMIQYSLRSEDTREDVSEIAKQFGGGGHRNAAGYQVKA
jgi:hypothetical protein